MCHVVLIGGGKGELGTAHAAKKTNISHPDLLWVRNGGIFYVFPFFVCTGEPGF